VTALEYFPYCPDLASAYHYLFSRLKSAFKERRFHDPTDVITKATAELESLCFQHLLNRWQRCVIAQGDYFQVRVA
jgi:hypothetical protein